MQKWQGLISQAFVPSLDHSVLRPPALLQRNNAIMGTVALLVLSNVFMTFAWYGHLKFTGQPLWKVVLISWGIAFFEYWLAVTANRMGYSVFTAAQLKTIQEIITLSIFPLFSILYLGETLRWNHMVGFCCLAAAAFFMFQK